MNIDECKWIWVAESPFEDNYFVDFRRTFELSGAECSCGCELSIACETDYSVWINGQFVGCGQFSDLPGKRHYDSYDVGEFVRRGKNIIAITGYHQGVNCFRYMNDTPGLIFSLRCGAVRFCSNCHCKARVSRSHYNGRIAMVTPQLGLLQCYDSSEEDGWQAIDYDDSHWCSAIFVDFGQSGEPDLELRPIAKLIELPMPESRVIKRGSLKRADDEHTGCKELEGCEKQGVEPLSFARIMAGDEIELYDSDEKLVCDDQGVGKRFIELDPGASEQEGANGVCVLIDLGSELFGHFHIDIEADAGTVVDFAHGEHITDGTVRYFFDGSGGEAGTIERNFADRYICRQGRQQWTMRFRRLGCQYLQLHITGFSSAVKLYYAGVLPVEYPVERRGDFECDVELHNRILEVGDATLRLCMHEHYEDTPWREQALYAMDARVQALCGYSVFGEYDFPRESIRLLGSNVRDDGLLALNAPGVAPITIPSFSLVWILMVKDYYDYSGRTDLIEEFGGRIKSLLDIFLSKLGDNGLSVIEKKPSLWYFYEWSPGLNGVLWDDESKGGYGYNQFCLDAFLILALDAAGELLDVVSDPVSANYYASSAKLRKAAAGAYYDKGRGLFRNSTAPNDNQIFSQLSQGLALFSGIFDGAREEQLVEAIFEDKGLEPATLSMVYYVLEPALRLSPERCSAVYDYISRDWGYMLEQGATSFWETIKGQADFSNAGSHSHAWSAIPVYFYFHYVLGVRPIGPGLCEFEFGPLAKGSFESAKGRVPTPYGAIEVAWKRVGDRKYAAEVKHPSEVKMSFPAADALGNQWDIKVADGTSKSVV